MDREIAKQVFRFFCEEVILDYNNFQNISLEGLIINRKSELIDILRTADSDIVDIRKEGNSLKTYHRNNPHIPFDFETEESEGTKILFRMMLSLFDIIRNGKLLLVDEIDISLHTQLVEFLIRIFNNSAKSQIIYTTHNTHLLNTNFQRRDQIYFVNKREDGSSNIYSLFDFKDFRDSYDMEKAYLQGGFDAIPYISEPNI